MRGEESWEEYSHIFELKTLFTITYMLSLMKDSMTFVLKNKNKLGGYWEELRTKKFDILWF